MKEVKGSMGETELQPAEYADAGPVRTADRGAMIRIAALESAVATHAAQIRSLQFAVPRGIEAMKPDTKENG